MTNKILGTKSFDELEVGDCIRGLASNYQKNSILMIVGPMDKGFDNSDHDNFPSLRIWDSSRDIGETSFRRYNTEETLELVPIPKEFLKIVEQLAKAHLYGYREFLSCLERVGEEEVSNAG